MAKGKRRNLTNRNQDHSPSPEPSTPTSPSPGNPNTPENLDLDLKAYLMMMVEDIKKDFNKSLKEIQENTAKELQVLKEKQENTIKQVEVLTEKEEKTYKQVMEMNKTILDLKREVDTIKKTQSEATLEIETLGKKSGTIDLSISNRIQEMEERISGAEDSIENIGTTIKENGKCKKILTQNIQEIQDTMRRPNLRIIGVDENEDFQLKGPANIFNKIIEENFPNLKKEMPMNIQEAYRTPNRLDQKRNSSRHIIIRTTNALNKDRILKAVREKGQVTYKGRPIRITPDFSPETMKARRSWTDVIQTLREHKCQPRLLYPAKLSITIDGETKIFHDKTKFTKYLSTNPALQKITDGKSEFTLKNNNTVYEIEAKDKAGNVTKRRVELKPVQQFTEKVEEKLPQKPTVDDVDDYRQAVLETDDFTAKEKNNLTDSEKNALTEKRQELFTTFKSLASEKSVNIYVERSLPHVKVETAIKKILASHFTDEDTDIALNGGEVELRLEINPGQPTDSEIHLTKDTSKKESLSVADYLDISVKKYTKSIYKKQIAKLRTKDV